MVYIPNYTHMYMPNQFRVLKIKIISKGNHYLGNTFQGHRVSFIDMKNKFSLFWRTETRLPCYLTFQGGVWFNSAYRRFRKNRHGPHFNCIYFTIQDKSWDKIEMTLYNKVFKLSSKYREILFERLSNESRPIV